MDEASTIDSLCSFRADLNLLRLLSVYMDMLVP